MATSRSIDENNQWRAGARIYSGRPDPTWEVSRQTVRSLMQIWDQLEPWTGPETPAPALGYRGCYLQDGDGSLWQAYHDKVVLRHDESIELRRDSVCAFERLIWSSAPPNTLPPWADEAGQYIKKD